jgi:hypothetical protein
VLNRGSEVFLKVQRFKGAEGQRFFGSFKVTEAQRFRGFFEGSKGQRCKGSEFFFKISEGLSC